MGSVALPAVEQLLSNLASLWTVLGGADGAGLGVGGASIDSRVGSLV